MRADELRELIVFMQKTLLTPTARELGHATMTTRRARQVLRALLALQRAGAR